MGAGTRRPGRPARLTARAQGDGGGGGGRPGMSARTGGPPRPLWKCRAPRRPPETGLVPGCAPPCRLAAPLGRDTQVLGPEMLSSPDSGRRAPAAAPRAPLPGALSTFTPPRSLGFTVVDLNLLFFWSSERPFLSLGNGGLEVPFSLSAARSRFPLCFLQWVDQILPGPDSPQLSAEG